jgi:hypothetical protein
VVGYAGVVELVESAQQQPLQVPVLRLQGFVEQDFEQGLQARGMPQGAVTQLLQEAPVGVADVRELFR